jgi:hypothetical protein
MKEIYTCGICGKKFIGGDKKEEFISHCQNHTKKIIEYTEKIYNKDKKTIEEELIFIVQDISLKVRQEVNNEWKQKNKTK